MLSLLRERFEEAGEAGTCSGVPDMMVSVSVLTPPMSLALRLRARSLCSLKRLLLLSSGAVVGPGIGGTRNAGRDEMVTSSGCKGEEGGWGDWWRSKGRDDRPRHLGLAETQLLQADVNGKVYTGSRGRRQLAQGIAGNQTEL